MPPFEPYALAFTLQLLAARQLGCRGLERAADGGCLHLAIAHVTQRTEGTLRVWSEPFVPLRLPKLFNLRTDPYERADITSNTYYQWTFANGYHLLAVSQIVGEFLETLKDFPPRRKPASFTFDQAMEKMTQGSGSH